MRGIPLFPEAASSFASEVDALYLFIVAVSAFFAVAAIARDNVSVLVFGLALSIALMGFAASFVARLLHRYRWIAYIGLLIILYVAVKMLLDGAVNQFPDQFGFLSGWFGSHGPAH